jgi:hypothetical protein
MISARIDVSKIDKSKLYTGKKGTYLDIVLFETPDDKYGNDYRIAQGVSKEDRAKGVKGAILGNGKLLASAGNTSSGIKNIAKEEKEDLPF